MSLSFDEMAETMIIWNNMDERLTKLIGFNPATCNHYGIIQLYNQRIDPQTSDGKILEIRSKYLEWRKQISDAFEENNLSFAAEEINRFFSVDSMFGTLYFLGIPVDIDGGADLYRPSILKLINDQSYKTDSTERNLHE